MLAPHIAKGGGREFDIGELRAAVLFDIKVSFPGVVLRGDWFYVWHDWLLIE
jgi:hypothetical protein